MSLGKRVRVWSREQVGRDAMGEPEYAWAPCDVANVLVRPLSGAEMSRGDTASDLRPDGIKARFRLAFPKGYDGPALRHAKVSLVDRPWSQDPSDHELAYEVVGDPQPEDPCPTQWNIICEVGRCDG